MLSNKKFYFIIAIILAVIAAGVIIEQRHQNFVSDYPNYQKKLNLSSQQFIFAQKPTTHISESLTNGYQLFINNKYEAAYNALLPWAKSGNPKALLVLGFLYEFGLDKKQNYIIASLWYYRAIFRNSYNDRSLARGIAYFYGIDGHLVNYKKSAQWFRMAAELSHDRY